MFCFFFSSRRRHTRWTGDWSSDVCSSDLIRDRALARLPDPPGGVRRELESATPVELLDRAVEADDPLLDEVAQRETVALVALGDRDDQAQVRVEHPLLCLLVAALDPLCELDLLGRGQQPMPADLVHEEGERVGGDDLTRLAARRLLLARALLVALCGRRDLDLASRELGRDGVQLVLVEALLEGERLELDLADLASFLGPLQEGLHISFQHFVHEFLSPILARALSASARRRSNRSIWLPALGVRSTPVYAG